MLEINSKNIRFLSRMGAQGVLGQAVYDFAGDGNKFYAVSADLGIAAGFERLIKNYPEMYIDTGIAEQSMLSVAAGIADDTVPAVAATWAAFATYRCADQMRVFMGCMKKNVKVIGLGSGMHIPYFGSSHYGIGDVAVVMSIPNIDIISPADGLETYTAIIHALKNNRSCYIRLTGGDTLPLIYNEENFNFKIGKANILKSGSDILIISCGNILSQVLKATELLENDGVSCMVADMHTIRPIDMEFLSGCKNFKHIFCIEEHSIFGGLGSVLAMALSELNIKIPFHFIGINDFFPVAGGYDYLLKQCGLDYESIYIKINSFL